jgi:hypothetical protein
MPRRQTRRTDIIYRLLRKTPFLMCCALLALGSCRRESGPPGEGASNARRGGAESAANKLQQVPGPGLKKEIDARAVQEPPIDTPDQHLARQRDLLTERAALDPELQDVKTETLIEKLRLEEKSVYGTDDRQDLFEVVDSQIQQDADGVVSVFVSDRMVDNGNGTSTLLTSLFGVAFKLCSPTEHFYNQPRGASCSGFLVAPDVVATAGHCVETLQFPLADLRFIFGFRMQDKSTAQTVISNDEIYRGRSIIARNLDGADWALVRLDRRVTNHRPLTVRKSGKVSDSQALQIIGYPAGLPIKFADGAVVRTNTENQTFTANLDSFGGNSGSPVFNSNTHVVEGILVRGEPDFVQQNQCWVTKVCPTTGCGGEVCTRVTQLAHLIP